MALPKVDDQQLAETLASVFRKLGYEGATLSRIAEATGLEKASLYHRFPGGKEEMVLAAAARVDERFGTRVLAPLTGPGDPAQRLRLVAQRLREFYQEGTMPCALDALSLTPVNSGLRDALSSSYSAWLEAFASLARESGATAADSRARAQRAIIQIEGALVVARVTGDPKPFRQAVASLPELLLEGGHA